jgi:hypothetical protein
MDTVPQGNMLFYNPTTGKFSRGHYFNTLPLNWGGFLGAVNDQCINTFKPSWQIYEKIPPRFGWLTNYLCRVVEHPYYTIDINSNALPTPRGGATKLVS